MISPLGFIYTYKLLLDEGGAGEKRKPTLRSEAVTAGATAQRRLTLKNRLSTNSHIYIYLI